MADIGVIELNEAFAAQSLAVLRELGLPDDAEHVNPNGGAIALGHPLGMSGARLALTAALELRHRDAGYALATMCIGVGQGIATLLARPVGPHDRSMLGEALPEELLDAGERLSVDELRRCSWSGCRQRCGGVRERAALPRRAGRGRVSRRATARTSRT